MAIVLVVFKINKPSKDLTKASFICVCRHCIFVTLIT